MAGELNLKVDQATYERTIDRLEGYVEQLKHKLDEYESKRREIDDIWEDEQATRYKRGIDSSIAKITDAMNATQTQIDQLQALLEEKRKSETTIGSVVDDVVTIVDALFL